LPEGESTADVVSLADVGACTCGPFFSGDLPCQLYYHMQLNMGGMTYMLQRLVYAAKVTQNP